MSGHLRLNAAKPMTRREFFLSILTALACSGAAALVWRDVKRQKRTATTFIASAPDYHSDIPSVVLRGMRELGVDEKEIRGKKILLKPNLVEPTPDARHINTHPVLVRGVAEAFLGLGAGSIVVAEGSGHCRDTLRTLELSGLADVLIEDRIPFVDLNSDDVYPVRNRGGYTSLKTLYFPNALREADWVVSIPKMKTHHWAGVTLSMKNLFGVMPGRYYGWPKNVLHYAGIGPSILDITATLKPHFAVVDGIVGMEGDGPIMGTPKPTGVVVMGRNLTAVDATGARIMGITPDRVPYLSVASDRLGPIREKGILQRGERIDSVRKSYELLERIPAHRGLIA